MAKYKELFLVAGKPCAGKSTVSRLAAEQLGNAYHFSIGDELRARAFGEKPSRYSRELRAQAGMLKQALPVPAHLANLVFEECVATSPHRTVIVDGYPQYPDRLPDFEETLARVGGRVVALCMIDIGDDEARKRFAGRAQRAADVSEDDAYISRRLAGYQQNLVPTIEALALRYPLHEIDGDRPPEAVAGELAEIIRSYR